MSESERLIEVDPDRAEYVHQQILLEGGASGYTSEDGVLRISGISNQTVRRICDEGGRIGLSFLNSDSDDWTIPDKHADSWAQRNGEHRQW